MITLTNIKKGKDYVELNYEPSEGDEIGYVKMDIHTKSLIEVKRTQVDQEIFFYWVHVKSFLWKLCDSEGEYQLDKHIIYCY